MINTITSEDLDKSLEYTYIDKITRSEYASFLRFLIMTIRKEMPVEILDNNTDKIIRAKVIDFSIDHKVYGEGEQDNLTLTLLVNDEKQTFKLINTGKDKVSKDSQNESRTFYRFYVYAENNEEGYRITFNRRVTKK